MSFQAISPQSTADLILLIALQSLFQLSAAKHSRGLCLSVIYVGLWHGLLLWLSLHSNCNRSAASLPQQAQKPPLCPKISLLCGELILASVPIPLGCRSSPTHSPIFLSSFILLSFVWTYIFLSGGCELLLNLSWCFSRSSMSEDVFLTHPWREKYSSPLIPPLSCVFLFTHFNVILVSELYELFVYFGY